MTGVWPVTNVWDFAQPRPKRIFSVPIFASSSTAPGSPVTYSPGNAEPSSGASNFHDRVQHRRRRFAVRIAVAVRFEADAVDRAIHFRRAENLIDLLGRVRDAPAG